MTMKDELISGTSITFYILPSKYNEVGLLELSTCFESYQSNRSGSNSIVCPVLVQNIYSARFVITKLVQSQRLERELRKLRPIRPLVVLKHSCFVKILDSDIAMDESSIRRHAWCIYAPTAEIVDRDEMVVDISGQPFPFSKAVPHDISSDAELLVRHPRTEFVSSTATTLTELEGRADYDSSLSRQPALLRRDSTTDPSSKSFHGSAFVSFPIKKYSCQRQTPLCTPNDGLVAKFQLMRLARELQCDTVGERAYSTIIASLRAIAFKIDSVHDIEGLEGCGAKTTTLIQERLCPQLTP